MVIALYFYFFLYVPNMPVAHYVCSGVSLVLGILIALFYLFDRLVYKPKAITRENSNMVTGGLIVLFIGFIIATYQNVAVVAGISAMVVGVFGISAMYLFLASMMVRD